MQISKKFKKNALTYAEKVKGIVLGILAALGIGYGAVDQYQYRSEQEYVVARAQGYNLLSDTDVKEEAEALGEVVSEVDGMYRVKLSEAKLQKSAVKSGIIVEPLIKYSNPSPIRSLNLFGCNFDPKPQPEPEPEEPDYPDFPEGQKYDWGVQRVDAMAGHSAVDSSSVKVCILDTGIDKFHPDLKHVTGRNFTTSNAGDYQDRDSHGTHVAGLVAAIDNEQGVLGASKASLYIGKVLSDEGYGYNDWIASGVNWCVSQGVDIISMSLGGPTPSSVVQNALQQASNVGIWIFVAAGNESSSQVGYPAGYRMTNLFSISATNRYDGLAYFSNFGKVEYTCPGQDILSSVPGGYAVYSGTSMATPICAGIGALYRAKGLPLEAEDMGDPVRFGKGMLHSRGAVGQ